MVWCGVMWDMWDMWWLVVTKCDNQRPDWCEVWGDLWLVYSLTWLAAGGGHMTDADVVQWLGRTHSTPSHFACCDRLSSSRLESLENFVKIILCIEFLIPPVHKLVDHQLQDKGWSYFNPSNCRCLTMGRFFSANLYMFYQMLEGGGLLQISSWSALHTI